jgi:hypothetical protein
VRPDHASLNLNGRNWGTGSDYPNGLHNGDQGLHGINDDFDFRPPEPSSAWPTYSKNEGPPWSVYTATESGPTRSSLNSVPMHGNLTGDTSALSDDAEIASVLSGGANISFYSQEYDQIPGDTALTVGLNTPTFQRKKEISGSATGTKDSADRRQPMKDASRSRGKIYPCLQCGRVLNCKSDLEYVISFLQTHLGIFLLRSFLQQTYSSTR